MDSTTPTRRISDPSQTSIQSVRLSNFCSSPDTPHAVSSASYNPLPSAYCRIHSGETALPKVVYDIFEAVDAEQSALLVALYMSAAFDAIDHIILTDQLKHTFAVSGQVSCWVGFSLHGRSKFVKRAQDFQPPPVVKSALHRQGLR